MTAIVRLRTIRGTYVKEDAKTWDDIDHVLHVEKTGDCRLLVMVPNYITDKITSFKSDGWELASIGATGRGAWKNRDADRALIATEGHAKVNHIPNVFRRLCEMYVEETLEVDVEPIIRVHVGKTWSGSSRGQTASIDFQFERTLRVVGGSAALRRNDASRYFEWSDELKAKKAQRRFCEDRAGNRERGGDDYRRKRIRQQV